MITEWIKMGFLLLSCFGYWEYFRSEHRINVYFAPVYTIAVQFMVLFAAGILNFLKEAALLLYIAGFLLFLQVVCKNKKRVFSHYLNVGYLYFVVAFIAVGVAVPGKQFAQIDNFTHWATVVRNILGTDRFPTFQDTAIEYTSYPLGSAAMLYYFCRATGEAEHMLMWAQAYLMLSSILPVFSACRKNRGFYAALVAVMTGFLFHYNIPLTELLVDTLMPLAGMAAVLFIGVHCAAGENETESRSPYYAIPLLIWTMNIKHAALLYVAFAIVILFLCVRKSARGRMRCLVITGAVLLIRMLWSRHCDYVFKAVSESMHSMSMEWFKIVIGEKSRESILGTVKNVLEHVLTRPEHQWLAAWLLLLGLLVWLFAREEKKRYKTFLLSGILFYVIYVVSIAVMYVVSMLEMEHLAAFSRYMRSVDVALYYMLTVFVGLLLSRITQKQGVLVSSAALVLLTMASWHWQTGKYVTEWLFTTTESERQKLEQPIEEYEIQTRKSYLLCLEQSYDPGYAFPRYIWRYRMESGTVEQMVVTDEAQLRDVQKYDYVIILDKGNPIIEDWLQENHPDQIGRCVIQQFA